MWLDRIPASVAFCDVETTGLGKDDRIVSFGGIGMFVATLANGGPDLAYLYLVFDPGRRNHHGAEQVHGFSDWVLVFRSGSQCTPRGEPLPDVLRTSRCPQRGVRLQIHQS